MASIDVDTGPGLSSLSLLKKGQGTGLQEVLRSLVGLSAVCGGSGNGKRKEAVGRQRRRVDRNGLSRVTEGCGRQRWRQLVREWTGPDCPESQRAVEDRHGGSWSEIIGGAPTTFEIREQTDRQINRQTDK